MQQQYRLYWISRIARGLFAAAMATGCVDATTVYKAADLEPPPSGDDGASAVGDGGPAGDAAQSSDDDGSGAAADR